jgi:hypothetical protein
LAISLIGAGLLEREVGLTLASLQRAKDVAGGRADKRAGTVWRIVSRLCRMADEGKLVFASARA